MLRRQRQSQRRLRWDRRFLEMALLVATWSKDPSTQTGCVVVRGRRVLATGYNGFPRGVRDLDHRYAQRELKYKFVAHCDRNAIDDAAHRGVPLAGADMYLTGPPCNECMKSIIQAGILRVVWPVDNKFERDPATLRRWADSIKVTWLMAEEARVQLERVAL